MDWEGHYNKMTEVERATIRRQFIFCAALTLLALLVIGLSYFLSPEEGRQGIASFVQPGIAICTAAVDGKIFSDILQGFRRIAANESKVKVVRAKRNSPDFSEYEATVLIPELHAI